MRSSLSVLKNKTEIVTGGFGQSYSSICSNFNEICYNIII